MMQTKGFPEVLYNVKVLRISLVDNKQGVKEWLLVRKDEVDKQVFVDRDVSFWNGPHPRSFSK